MTMTKIFRIFRTRLDCVHVVPGDARNKIVEDIVNSDLVTYGVVAIYNNDQSMFRRCAELEIPFTGLGFTEKHLLRQFFSLLFYVFKVRPRSLFLHSFYPSLIGAGLSFLCPFTKVISVRHHNMVHVLSKNRKGVFLDKMIARISFLTIAVSHAVKQTMISQGCKSKKILVIHNGVRLADSFPKRLLAPPSHSKIKLIAIGRLDWQKNYETMLRVASKLKKSGIDFHLSILGTGSNDYSQSLFQMTQDLALTDCVEWLGWQENIEKWISESDIFLHTSLDEACPLVLIEALLVGIPIVASNAGGSAEVISNFAQGCPVNDISAYVEGINHTWENFYEVALKSQSQIPFVEKKFGMNRMRKEYESSVLSLLR